MPARLLRTAVVLLLALVALCLAWELWLAPLRPGGSWLVLKVIPLLAALRGVLSGQRYTYQWLSLCIWLYVAEGLVRATSDSGPTIVLAALEIVLALAIFAACAGFARLTAPSRATKP